MKTKRLTGLAMLTTVALIIFVIELQIPNPFPIPGVKLGLANIITVYAVYRYSAKEVASIVITRIILATIFSGNMIAMLYSFAGSFLCLSGMLVLRYIVVEKYIWVSSVLGAVFHNIGQITVAVLITRTPGLIAYFPFLVVSGCLAGAFTGICAQAVLYRVYGGSI